MARSFSMRGVMAGMQPGGKYADLRAEFNATMTAERAFASAYDKVAASAGASTPCTES